MEKRMKETSVLMVVAIGIMVIQCGCTAQRPERVGFLSSYAKLESVSNTSMRYIAPGGLRNYSKFIIDPVGVRFYFGSKGGEQRKYGKITKQDLTDMKNYMHAAILKALSGRYSVAYQPGPGVARVKVALTDLKKSKAIQNLWPGTKLVGTGLGGASLEAEVIDSQTGEQIAALVESQLGSRLSLDGITKWGDAKAVMDGWAKRFRKRLDEAHGH